MREAALKEEEAQKIQDDNMKLKAKIQSDVDFIEQKLREDEREKNQQINIDIARNKAVRTPGLFIPSVFIAFDLFV